MRTLAVTRDEGTGLLVVRCSECGTLHAANAATSAGRVWLQRLSSFFSIVLALAMVGITFVLGLVEMVMQAATLDHRTSWGQGGRVVMRMGQDELLTLVLMFAVSGLAAFVMVTWYTCAAHHWSRWAYVVLACAAPLVPFSITWYMWLQEAPALEAWGLRYMLGHYALQASSGVVGAFFGRPAMRTASRVLLPPGMRSSLSFLWTADGLEPPRAERRRG